jgi:signal transduction histidine kinase/ActR/RegA family two-component response regulator
MTATRINRPTDIEEQQRLSLLAELGVLDTDPEPGFDALTHAAAALTQCPIALISLVDGERQWFKARLGLDVTQTPREWAFCSDAILTPDLMEVRDASADLRFATNPLVVGRLNIRFYAGQPLTVDGIRIGTLCVIDTKPRELRINEREALQDLGAAASAMLTERRKRAVSAEQQRRLTEFAMVAGDWLWETDAQHRIVWMSCAYGNNPPLPEPWLLGQPMADGLVLESPDHPPGARTKLHRLFDKKLGFARALVQCEIDGRQRYLSHSAVCRRDLSGRWNGYRGITRDVTAGVAAEASHREAAALLTDLCAQVPGVIFQMRMDGLGRVSFPFVSNRVDAVCELSAARLIKHAKAALVRCHREDAGRVMESIRTSAARPSVWRETFRMVLPRAGERTLMVHAEPRAVDGGGVLWHGLLTDVTEQIVAARHLQQLTLAQVAAEKAVEVRSEFMSRVSHELRTPLNAILGFAQMLRMAGPTQSAATMLDSVLHIETAGAHLLALVNDMLDLSSLDAGRLNLNLQPVSLAPLVERCMALIEPHALQHGITLEVDVGAPLPTVLADVRAVKQLLFNLLGNAVKFADPNTVVRLRLRYEALAAEVTLAIADAGPGIAPEKLSSLFEPFTRIQTSRATTTGSGLGLSICQKLVWAMAGRIDVASVPGQGTTFTVGLPADGRADPMPADDSAFGDLLDPLPAEAVGPARVLYIEDEAVNALLMQALFESLPDAGARLVVAANGAQGLLEAVKWQPNLILLDMNLPDMDGLGVLHTLRSDPRTAHVPVIAVSADALPEQIRNARAAGIEDYWTKPINLKRVHAELLRRFPAPPPNGRLQR